MWHWTLIMLLIKFEVAVTQKNRKKGVKMCHVFSVVKILVLVLKYTNEVFVKCRLNQIYGWLHYVFQGIWIGGIWSGKNFKSIFSSFGTTYNFNRSSIIFRLNINDSFASYLSSILKGHIPLFQGRYLELDLDFSQNK